MDYLYSGDEVFQFHYQQYRHSEEIINNTGNDGRAIKIMVVRRTVPLIVEAKRGYRNKPKSN